MTGSTGVDGGCNSGAGSAAVDSAATDSVTEPPFGAGDSTTSSGAALGLVFLGALAINQRLNWFWLDWLEFWSPRGVNVSKCRHTLDGGCPEWFKLDFSQP